MALDMVYRGDPNLIHISDGKRAEAGRYMAATLTKLMRQNAQDRDDHQRASQRLCPGCYMVVGLDMMVSMAHENGQSITELARTMRDAWDDILANPDKGLTEEIIVKVDPC